MTTAKSSPDRLQPWINIPATGPLLRPKAAATYLGCSVTQLYRLVAAGVVPKPFKATASGVASGIPRPWLDAVIAARAAEVMSL